MRFAFRLLLAVVVTLGLLAGTASAQVQVKKMHPVFQSPNGMINSDFAFWGHHAFAGYYRNDISVGGFRIFDVSDPAKPELIRDFRCDGLQNDPIVWDRDGNGIADLMLLAVDRTMAAPNCGAPRSVHPDGSRYDGDPMGWEGVRVFTMSDDPDNPFANIQQVKAVYTDCGAHTITLWPEFADDATNPRLIVYASSYPLRPGPTCGVTQAPTPPFQNTANPYDEDPGSPNNPLHGVIQTIEVPLNSPGTSHEITPAGQRPISYPGDPDGKQDWSEKGFAPPPAFEPAAVACHDIVVHVMRRLAGGACAEQGQVWSVLPNGLLDTEHPISIGDDEVSSGGTGQFPGAVDFFHSVMFNNDGTVVNWVDESFGEGCPTETEWQARPWHPAGTHKTGRMFFSDLKSPRATFLSEFHVGDLRPQPFTDPPPYCSAHMGMAVMGIERDLLVNAWYTGGVDVIDFSDPVNLKEIAYYKFPGTFGSDNWSAYPYTGPMFKGAAPHIPVYASDGVEDPPTARGTVVFRANLGVLPDMEVDHLNPQTMD